MHVMIRDIDDHTVSLEAEDIEWNTVQAFRYALMLARALDGSFDISWGPGEIRDLDDFDGWQLEVYAGLCNLFRREPGGIETRVTPRELKRYID